MNLRTTVSIALLSCTLAVGRVSYAQTIINVRPDQGSVQDAINSIPDGGIIEFAAGTYNAPSGGFTIYGGTKGFTMRAAPGAAVTLSGHGATDILRFTESSHVMTFQGLTFADGLTTENFIGGAMTLVNVNAIFTACVFENNFAGASAGTGGGGLWINVAVVSFKDCVWKNNSSPNFGAGMTASDSRVHLRGCSFTGNRVNLPNHGRSSAGAGIYGVNSVIQVSNCGFDNNQAGCAGGAIYLAGDWNKPPSFLNVADSEFTGNVVSRDPSVPFSDPPVGGAIHTENQTDTTLTRCRFTNNIGRQGGALSLFQSVAQITDCVFRGNRSTGQADGEGFGGTINALSTDFANQPGAIVNHRPISLKVTDTLFEGAPGVSGAREGACIYAAGDLNSAFGLNGVPQNGSLESNRGVVELVRVGIFNYAAVGGGGLPGTGGAILGGFINLTINDSMIANCTATNSGAGLQLNENSVATISRSIISNCSSVDPGAAITMFGGTLNASQTSFIQNHTSSTVRGAVLTTAPQPADASLPAFDVTGVIQNCIFSGNSGATTIYDGDRSSSPFNRLQHSENQFFPDSLSLYVDDLSNFKNVQLLNTYTIARSDGTTTVKSPTHNTALTSAPVVTALLMVPRSILQSGAPGETVPIPSNLVYASSGGSVGLDGIPQSNSSGIVSTTVNGVHTLTVGSTSIATVPPPNAALNISTRLPVGTGQNVLIGGFIVQGPIPKNVIIRAMGPSLPLPGALQDPFLELHDGTGAAIATNDNWRSTQTVDVHASSLAPSNEAESAIIVTLNPGAYTAVVRGANNSTGIAVVEAYDLDAERSSKLANIATRGSIQTGDNVMIGGFILGGGTGPTKVLVRGIGPSLGAFGITNPLVDPMLELHNSNGALIDSNDDWKTNQALIQPTGLQPTNDAESALLLPNPAPGAYTVILRGKNEGTGVGVVEAYVL